jgi:signal transduction histidine kinase
MRAPDGMSGPPPHSGAPDGAATQARRYAALAQAGVELATLRNPQALIEAACALARGLFETDYALAAATPSSSVEEPSHCAASGLPAPVLPLTSGWLGSVHADRITRRLSIPDGSAQRLGLPAGCPAMHAALAAPLVSATDCHGWLCVATSQGGGFSPEDEPLLTLLAALAGRLYEGVMHEQHLREQAVERERSNHAMLAVLQRLEALRALDAEILAARSPRGVVRAGLEHLSHLVPYWGASVTLADPSGEGFIVLASLAGPGASYNPGQYLTRQQYGDPDIEILRRGEIRDVPDIEALGQRPPVVESLYRQGMRAYARIPMLVDGALIGALNLGADRPNHFAREQLEFARGVANQLGIAAQQATLRERIARQAAELEQRVIERTAQLAAANEDLEAFSFTVSHDLRAPLRAIDGFSRMFLEDYGGCIDEQGRHMLATIRNNSQRMGALIDDLLRFAKLGRARVSAGAVDMNALAREAWREVSADAGQAAARIRFELEDLPPAEGDFALIKQVWLNLLSNACKYSGKREEPLIMVDATEGDNEVTYRVADNGAGFDMKYYEKLFGVFQRLHTHDEFPGTGVGLAMVHRVITRHGGRVWADSIEGRGAQFYFSLPRASTPPA